MQTKNQTFVVSTSESGMKLQAFLKIKLGEEFSLRQIKRLIEQNFCSVNGKVERFASSVIAAGDKVTLQGSLKEVSFAFEKNRILYEDEALVVYNKPPGISSLDHGVKELLSAHYSELQLVHRLDKDTSGLLLFVKSKEVLDQMIEQFREKKVNKIYAAIVDGILEKEGVIENALGKLSSYQGQSMWGKVEKGGLYAKTEWRSEAIGKKATFVTCKPITGRTHQIRVHMKEMGHPLLGDYQYGRKFSCNFKPQRCLLHAWKLSFLHPLSGKLLNLQAPLPEDFIEACHGLQIVIPSRLHAL